MQGLPARRDPQLDADIRFVIDELDEHRRKHWPTIPPGHRAVGEAAVALFEVYLEDDTGPIAAPDISALEYQIMAAGEFYVRELGVDPYPGLRRHFLDVVRRIAGLVSPLFAETSESTTSGDSRHVVITGIDSGGVEGAISRDMSAVDNRVLVGRNIRLARDYIASPRLNQAQLAAELGVQRHQLSDWERGRFEPRHDTLEQIAVICKVPGAPEIGWFFHDHTTGLGGRAA